MSNLTNAVNLEMLVKLEKALGQLDLPWIKGVRQVYVIAGDGVYFNAEEGDNVVAVTNNGIRMPTILSTKFGLELSDDFTSEYSYTELFVRLIDVVGPKFTHKGIESLKTLAKSV